MGITSEDTFGTNQTAQPNSPTQDHGAPAPEFAYGDFNVTNSFGAPLNEGLGSEFYTKLRDKIVEEIKQANPKFKVTLLGLDNNDPAIGIRYSTLLVASELTDNKEVGVAYHTLVLAATGKAPDPVTDQVNNVRVTVLRFASDAVDEKLSAAAKKVMKATFPNRRLYYAGTNVVPANFNLEDKMAVKTLAYSATTASGTEIMQQKPGFRDMNLPKLLQGKGQIQSITSLSRTFTNMFGQAVRSDLQFRLVSKPKTDGENRSLNDVAAERDIVKVSAYVEIVYSPMAPQNNMVYQMGPLPKFAARLVITDIQSSYGYTPGIVMLGIAAAIDGVSNGNWMHAFRPKQTNGIDLTDIGALNIEQNTTNDQSGYGQIVDTKGAEVKLENIGAFMLKCIQNGIMVSVDVPDNGPQSWYLSFLAAAAAKRISAIGVLRSSMNELTGGKFDSFHGEGKALFAEDGSPILLGQWPDSSGSLRDVRDVDYLAAANVYSNKPEHIRGFSDTYLRTDYPVNQRLHARVGYINSITNDKAEYTGRANRVTLAADLVNAIAGSVKATGLSVNTNSDLMGGDFNDRRGVATFAASALAVTTGAFNAYSAGGGGNTAYYYDNARW